MRRVAFVFMLSLGLSIFLTCTGCVLLSTVSVTRLTSVDYLPTPSVKVYYNDCPDPYIAIAELDVNSDSTSDLADKARQLGANAIIITGVTVESQPDYSHERHDDGDRRDDSHKRHDSDRSHHDHESYDTHEVVTHTHAVAIRYKDYRSAGVPPSP